MKMAERIVRECVVYCRVSSESQLRGYSLQRQIEGALALADDRGFIVVGIFCEQAGSKDEKRARKQCEMMARRRQCSILCESPDRWTRTVEEIPENVIWVDPGVYVLQHKIAAILSCSCK
jgi:DNA invertase Pin-like site-specific DNA recombinase